MSWRGSIRWPALALLAGALLDPGAAALGQERAQRRVGDLVLVAPPDLEPELERLAEAAAVILPRLEHDLGTRARAPFRIFLLGAPHTLAPDLRRLDAMAPPWASGFLLSEQRVGAIRLRQVPRYPYDGTAEVLAHEITHQLLADTGLDLPRWFGEGIASWEGRRRGLRDFAVATAAMLSGRLPPLSQLDRELVASPERARVAYAASLDFVGWSHRRYGADLVVRLLDQPDAASFADAWRSVTGDTLSASERSWRRRTLLIHRWVPLLASSGTLWVGLSLLAMAAAAVKRRRKLELYRRWEEEDRRRELAESGGAIEDDDDGRGGDGGLTIH